MLVLRLIHPGKSCQFSLDIGNQVDVAYDQDLEGLLAVIGYDGEHEVVIGVEKLLIEKSGRV